MASLEHPHDKPLSLALQLLVSRPVGRHLQQFLAQGAGINMSLKVVCYLLRLRILLNPTSSALRDWQALEVACVEGRMLTGMWRWLDAPKAIERLTLTGDTSSPQKVLFLLVTMLSIVFRAIGQLSGDLMYTQKYLVPTWSFPRLLWHYRFSKCFAQVFASVLDLRTLLKYATVNNKMTGGLSLDASTPASTATPSTPRLPPDERATKIRLTSLALLRNLADIVVYGQWMSSYHPNKMFEYGSGLLSGVIGVYFAWLASGEQSATPLQASPKDSVTTTSK